MQETEVTFPSSELSLAGTLASPREPDGRVAVIISGSGPIDRNSDHKRMQLSIGKLLAQFLGEHGWQSLRFDKRGVGQSEGDYWACGFFDNVADAASAVRYMQDQVGTEDVVLVGHSEGALIAGELVATLPGIAGAILLSPTAKTGEQTLIWQAAQLKDSIGGVPGAIIKLLRLDVLKQQSKQLDRIRTSTDNTMRVQLVAKINARWFREFMVYDPVRALRETQAPVLALTGSKDIQVNPNDLTEIDGLSDLIDTRLIPDVDHILRHEPHPKSNPRRYKAQSKLPLDEGLLSAMTDWLNFQSFCS